MEQKTFDIYNPGGVDLTTYAQLEEAAIRAMVALRDAGKDISWMWEYYQKDYLTYRNEENADAFDKFTAYIDIDDRRWAGTYEGEFERTCQILELRSENEWYDFLKTPATV